MSRQITKLIEKQGLVGLQKLEAEGKILPEFARRVGNVHWRRKEGRLASQVARGIGTHQKLETILEMIEWLRDNEYLIDYGSLTVTLAICGNVEVLEYFQSFMDDEDDIVCIDFMLDYKKMFSPEITIWLEDLKREQEKHAGEDRFIVRTSIGYSYTYKQCIQEVAPELLKEEKPYMKVCHESGMHYNRYHGYICCD